MHRSTLTPARSAPSPRSRLAAACRLRPAADVADGPGARPRPSSAPPTSTGRQQQPGDRHRSPRALRPPHRHHHGLPAAGASRTRSPASPSPYPNGAQRRINPTRDGDPSSAATPAATTAANVLVAARSRNDFMQGCTPTSNEGTVASTTLNYGLGHGYEGFQWVGPS